MRDHWRLPLNLGIHRNPASQPQIRVQSSVEQDPQTSQKPIIYFPRVTTNVTTIHREEC